MRPFVVRCVVPFVLLAAGVAGAGADSIWDLQQPGPDGVGIHPKVGADPTDPANRVVVEGIALNRPDELLDPALMWQVYVQAEEPDRGGIAGWAGVFYNATWPKYPAGIEPGDRIRIEGFVADHQGKVNINERHSAAPDLAFTVTVLDPGAGMPEPTVIPSVAACTEFDADRLGGGELYQGQWCELRGIRVVDGTWAAGETVTVTDDDVHYLPVLLSAMGDFSSRPGPTGEFDAVGIFDQEDLDPPTTGAYRLWVKTGADVSERAAIRIDRAVEIRWLSESDRVYQAYRSVDGVEWTPIGDPVAGSGEEMHFFDRADRGRSFYEVRVIE